MVTAEHAGAVLTIDLGAIVANYRLLCGRLGTVPCAAVLKADAYGLGIGPVATALAGDGCQRFFVALLSEAVALRRVLRAEFEHDIYVLNGVAAGEEQTFAEHALIPLLNTPGDIERWGEFARQGAAGGGGGGGGARAVLQLDTGMSRLGLSPAEVAAVISEEAFDHLDGPVARLAGPEVPAMPFSPPLEQMFLLDADKIANAIRELARY